MVLTAQRSYRCIDGLHEHVLAVQLLQTRAVRHQPWGKLWDLTQPTSSKLFASNRIQPSSMTSAESRVTYTPCSSHVVATCITTYRSTLKGVFDCVAMLADEVTEHSSSRAEERII